jgi:polar amino acid transport system permease protein
MWQSFVDLYAGSGLNFSYLFDTFDRQRFIQGLGTTVWLSAVCIAASITLGIVGAWASVSGRLGQAVINCYVQVFRNTPPLVQLYLFFFAVGALLPRIDNGTGHAGPLLNNIQWAVISLSLYAGAFNVEIFRSGVEAVPRATIEAAEALGYTHLQVYRFVILPLALRTCLPSLTNSLVETVKTTSLAYTIGVPELLYVASQIWADELNVPEMMVSLLASYLFLIAVVVVITHVLERLLRIPGYAR